MARLVLINGAPGSGKSTLAHALSDRTPMALALDIDLIKHSIGGWEADPIASGLHARRLALALADAQLRSGLDVFVGQYLARTEFIEQLHDLARRHSASFHEIVLDVDADHLAMRLQQRVQSPSRPEHAVNGRLVAPADASRLIASLAEVRRRRPDAVWIDANGEQEQTVALIAAAIR